MNARRALVIADNKLALNADWDIDALKVELEDLAGDFGELMGFSQDELVDLLKKPNEGLTDDDHVPEALDGPILLLLCAEPKASLGQNTKGV